MRIDVITTFPKMFEAVLNESIIKRAQQKRKVDIYVHNLRDYSLDKHKKVDDRPYGGGCGMIMKPEPIFRAVDGIFKKRYKKTKTSQSKVKIILLSPQGKLLNHQLAKDLCRYGHLILICGHYEGVDERVRKYLADEEISIGDYVLTGGELPAMVLIDCVVRFIPGVLGNKKSLKFESLQNNLLEYPQYTRPLNFRGMRVPRVLLSGDHKKIEEFRIKEAWRRTLQKRPDLLKRKGGDCL
ncbi:MAG: tRNA (guanosine(37)-N1)-methyltransferase TrmD [Candidatus Omnitrophica bacterium]|nr:tRNA (guanosine(37)-N1)-methyltransferase TrmD [Candidatus Omnitrophota bacterium]